MIVHQAIYGDKSGSYALLKTTLADVEPAKRICNVTDLLDRPSTGYLTQPVFRGFAFNKFYVFIKSFPDNDPSVRTGRVLSHTLIVDLHDLYILNNLDDLFSHFLSDPDKDPRINPIILEDVNSVPTQTIDYTSREAAAINGLLNHSSYNNTLVWIGEEGYLSLVTQVWSKLKGNLRATLRLGIGFDPRNVDPQKTNILYVMEEYESKWKTSGHCIVGKEELGTLESMPSLLLAGYQDESKPLNALIESFGIVPTEIEDYRYLGIAYNHYKKSSTEIDFNSLIALCDLISKFSPDPKIAKTAKQKLLTETISRIELATAKQILTLKNPDWKGFSNAQKLVGDQVANWAEKSLFNSKVDNSITTVIATAFDPENKVEWWKKAFLDGLRTALEKWESSYATVVWDWFTADHDLVETLGSLIPATTQIETDLVNDWPKPESELAEHIQIFAERRSWLTLHGLSALQLYGPEESIKRQLRIDTDTDHFAALNKMGELIRDKEFTQLTVKIGESRLVEIAGAKVTRTPSLLGQLDVKSVTWRQIWLKAIEQGNKPWVGVKKPLDVLFSLLEEVLNGEAVEPQLLLRLSTSDYNDLSTFTRRAEVWQHLSERTKAGFINASALGCVKLIDNENLHIEDLEKEIRTRLIDPTVIELIIEDPTIHVSTKLQLFEELPGLRENELLILLNTVYFSSLESKRLGKLILEKRWKKATNVIARKITKRGDLKPALTECKTLLGFFDRLMLSFSGDLSETVSAEDWWGALTEQCYIKYPKGPTDKGLWGRSGGENYDLLAIGTGREIWVDTIDKMRNGRTDVDVQRLLQEMSEDHPSSNELQQLIRTYEYHAKR